MSTKKAYVVGTNVSTSLSPFIFQYWFKKYNIDRAEYGFIEIKEENFDKKIKSIIKDENIVGINVTIPYKEKIVSYVDNSKNLLKKTRHLNIIPSPVNCVTFNRDPVQKKYGGFKILGENTDSLGFENAVLHNFNAKENYCAIVLGYGGASKAIINELTKNSCFKNILVFNRTFSKIKNIKKIFGERKPLLSNFKIEPLHIEDLANHTNKADLIVNTAPVNMLGGLTKWDIGPKCYGFDVVYRPWEGTGFLKNFQETRRIEGIYMLVHQAAPCFEKWFGIEPQVDEEIFENLYKKLKKNK